MRLSTRQPSEEDGHRPSRKLVVGDLVARVPEHQRVELLGGQLAAVALALHQLDRSYGQGSTIGWPAMSLRGRFPPSHALTVAPTSANSPTGIRPAAFRPSTEAIRSACSREWSGDGVVGSQP